MKLGPRYLLIVLALAGDSTITSDLPLPVVFFATIYLCEKYYCEISSESIMRQAIVGITLRKANRLFNTWGLKSQEDREIMTRDKWVL